MGTRSSDKRRRSASGGGTETDGEVWELSKSQVRELRRRVRDLEDQTRYLLVSVFTSRMALYYNVSNDRFGMNDPSLGTLFKARAAAVAIQRLLRTGIQVVKCRADRHDRVVKSSLPRLRPGARLLPVGRRGGANLGPELHGPVFEPLRDPVVFGAFQVHPEFQTLVWPNGADFAPEFLHDNVRVTA